ncbi:MAG: MFS transporter [Chloroflexota bacterium]
MAHSFTHATDGAPSGGRFSALKSSDFRTFWIASLVSQCGGWAAQVATSWLLLEMTNSAFYLGLQGLFLAVPFIASSMVAGAVADRMDRKRLLLITQWGSLAVSLAQAVMVHMGIIEVWHIYLFSSLSWICAGFETAARQSLLPNMVQRHQIPSAIALYSTLHRTTALIGPALGGLAIAQFGVAGALYSQTIGWALLVWAVMLMRTVSIPRGGSGPLFLAVKAGFTYARADRKIAALLAIQATASVLVNSGALLPIYARDILQIGPQGLGLLHSVTGAGSLAGMALVIWLGHHGTHGRWIVFGSTLYPVFLAGFGVSTFLPLSLLMLFLSGLVEMTVGTLRQTVMQLSVNDAYRGRVMSLSSISARGLHPIGNLQSGTLATLMGAPFALVASAGLAIGLAVWIWSRTPEFLSEAGVVRNRPAASRSHLT